MVESSFRQGAKAASSTAIVQGGFVFTVAFTSIFGTQDPNSGRPKYLWDNQNRNETRAPPTIDIYKDSASGGRDPPPICPAERRDLEALEESLSTTPPITYTTTLRPKSGNQLTFMSCCHYCNPQCLLIA